MAKTLSEKMADKFDVLDKAKKEINALNISGVSAKVVKKKKREISKSVKERIAKAREQLKGLRRQGR